VAKRTSNHHLAKVLELDDFLDDFLDLSVSTSTPSGSESAGQSPWHVHCSQRDLVLYRMWCIGSTGYPHVQNQQNYPNEGRFL